MDSTYWRKLDQNILDQIESDVYKYKHTREIILMGDLNARTGENIDHITNDSQKHLPLNEDYTVDI